MLISNLIKKTIITVPWEKFKIIDGGNILQRNLVEAFIDKPSSIFNIISIMAFQSYGYCEYANISANSNTIFCGQILYKDYQNSQNGSMKILITHM